MRHDQAQPTNSDEAKILAAWKATDEHAERAERDIRSGRIRPRDDVYERMGGPATGYTGEKLEVYRREQILRIGRREERLAELRRLTDEMVLQIGWSKRVNGVASGRTEEEAELGVREQMWRRCTKEERLAEMRRRTSHMVLQDGWYERMGGVASGRTQDEAELRLREQMWRRSSLGGNAEALERRIVGRRLREAAGRG